jgi:D-cysteine desulfhydrase family pyridoxal phosphate-dependent enzyme
MKLPSRQPIAHSPTPLEHLPRITMNLGGPDIWVKRDDLTGLALGGNKIRKLEFFLADALNKGADTLITAGAIQSNHCRQTAAVAAKFGLACLLVLTDQRPKELTANNYLDTLLGAQIIWAGDQDRESALNEAVSAAQETGKQPYLVPYGGSNALGACAYLHAMQELAAQTDTPFEWIIFATSSGATQAGLELGRREFMPSAKVLGISVDMKSQAFAPRISTLTNDCAALVGLDFQSTPQDILVSDAYLGAGYAQMGPAEEEAIQLFAREEALLIDPVYTGRAAAGLIDLVRSGNIKKDEKVLFWHTGGAPALFAPQYLAQLTKS